ncbi:MAG: hypothetical protein ACJAWW_001266, partial [Sulfurimonas sp.]
LYHTILYIKRSLDRILTSIKRQKNKYANDS